MEFINKIQAVRQTSRYKNDMYRYKKNGKNFILNIFIAVILIGICFVILSPLIGILSESFMDIQDVYNPLVYMIPENFTLYNFQAAWQQMSYPKTLLYTVGFSGIVMLIQVIICSLVGYGFARFKFPGCNVLFALVVLTIVVPVQTITVPLYMQFRSFFGTNLLNTPWPVVLMTLGGVGLRSGVYIYIFRQFFKGLPKEIEEAAFIDGAGPVRTFFTVMLPNAQSSIIIVMMFSFVWQYNDTFFAGTFMNRLTLLSTQVTTLAPKLGSALGIRDTNFVSLIVNSGIVLTILPLIITYLFLQRYFMEGIERSGIVG